MNDVNKRYPLGMPEGSVRSILAIMVVVIFGATVYFDVPESAFTATVALTSTVVTSYFKDRKREEGQ